MGDCLEKARLPGATWPVAVSPRVPPTDAELLARVRNGDVAAFAEFYDRHAPLLFGIALRILRVPAEAEEAFQEACVTIWERAPQAGPGSPLSLGWAVTIVRHRAIDRLRTGHRRAELLATAEEGWPVAGGDAPDAAALSVAGETAAAVRRALASLPADQRIPIELAFFAGLTQQEIAGRLQLPLGTVKARIRRGMMALRDELEGMP